MGNWSSEAVQLVAMGWSLILLKALVSDPKEEKFHKNKGINREHVSKKRTLGEFHSGQKAYPRNEDDKDFSMVSAANESAHSSKRFKDNNGQVIKQHLGSQKDVVHEEDEETIQAKYGIGQMVLEEKHEQNEEEF